MATNAAKECNICNEEYDEGERCPRSLPCSHCICSDCVQNLITRNTKKCPLCLRDFQASSAKDIGINTSLLDLLKFLKEMEQRLSVPHGEKTTPLANSAVLAKLKRQSKELLDEFVVCYDAEGKNIDDAIQQHIDLQDNLIKDLQCAQNEVMAEMKEVTKRTLQKVNYIESQKKKLEKQKKLAENRRSKHEGAVQKLEASVNFKDAGPVIDEVDEVTSESTKVLQMIKEMIAEDEEKSRLIKKVSENTKLKLQRILNILRSSSQEEEQLDLSVDMQLLEIQNTTTQRITIDALRERTEPAVELEMQENLSDRLCSLSKRPNKRTIRNYIDHWLYM